MKEPIRDRGRLEHILQATDNALQYTSGMSYEALANDKIVCHAVTYNIQVIGEAASRLSEEFKSSHTDIDWRDVISMRNILVNDYYNVDFDVLWNVLKEDLPPFRELIIQYLNKNAQEE